MMRFRKTKPFCKLDLQGSVHVCTAGTSRRQVSGWDSYNTDAQVPAAIVCPKDAGMIGKWATGGTATVVLFSVGPTNLCALGP
jgi:hypothetical protein